MGYLFLSIALISGAAKAFCGKKVSGKVQALKDVMLTNSIRMFLCLIIGFFVTLLMEGSSSFQIDLPAIFVSAGCGITSSMYVVSWVFCVQKGAYMMTDVFSTLGLILPILLSTFFFQEQIRLNQWIGFVTLIIAVSIMCSYNNTIKAKLNIKSLLILILCGFSNGASSFLQKVYVKHDSTNSILAFNFYTYIFAFLVLSGCYLVLKKQNTEHKDHTFSLRSVYVYVIVMSICLFLNSYALTVAAGYLDSMQLYPLNTGLSLVISSSMSSVLFKEKITFRAAVGILLTFASLIIINVL